MVVGCYHLGRRKSKKSLNYEVVGEVTVKSHWQEPAVFSLTLPLLPVAASERSSRGTELKIACEESENQTRAK